MMNVMFVMNGKLVTPQLSTAILDGVTRDSILTIARDLGKFEIEERRVSIDEIEEAFVQGTLTEAFGTGTAAVVAPIAVIHINGKDYQIPEAGPTSFQQQAKTKLSNMRTEIEPDKFSWNYFVNP